VSAFGIFMLDPNAEGYEQDEVNLKVTKSEVSLQVHIPPGQGQQTGCRATNKVSRVDPQTGQVMYDLECTGERRVPAQNISLTATLAEEPPSWALTLGGKPKERLFRGVQIIGKVKRQGPNWVLTDAHIVDIRYHKQNQ